MDAETGDVKNRVGKCTQELTVCNKNNAANKLYQTWTTAKSGTDPATPSAKSSTESRREDLVWCEDPSDSDAWIHCSKWSRFKFIEGYLSFNKFKWYSKDVHFTKRNSRTHTKLDSMNSQGRNHEKQVKSEATGPTAGGGRVRARATVWLAIQQKLSITPRPGRMHNWPLRELGARCRTPSQSCDSVSACRELHSPFGTRKQNHHVSPSLFRQTSPHRALSSEDYGAQEAMSRGNLKNKYIVMRND